ALSHEPVLGTAMGEAALEVLVPNPLRVDRALEPREVVGLLGVREADLRVLREVAAQRGRATAGGADDEEVGEGDLHGSDLESRLGVQSYGVVSPCPGPLHGVT